MPGSARSTSGTATLEITDNDLVRRAAAGDNGAFEELYRRHSQAAWRVAQAVSHNAHDAADAVSEAFTRVFQALPSGRLSTAGSQFRPYLLTATRNAAIDGLRRQGKTQPSDVIGMETPEPRTGPTDKVMADLDATLVAQAFSTLPERWRTILWLTEVEGMAPRDAAEVLDLTPNGAAQLAVRARAGLRERYLQAHLLAGVQAECQTTVKLLGAYVAGGLAARDIARVDQHLPSCADCRARVAELEDLQSTLRRIVLPFPLALAALAGGAGWAAKLGIGAAAGTAGAGAGRSGLSLASIADGSNDTLRTIHKPLLYTSVAMFAVGIMATATVDGRNDPQSSLSARPAPVASTPTPASVDIISDTQAFNVALASGVAQRDGGGAQVADGSTTRPGDSSTPPAGGGSTPPTTAPPAPKPVVNTSARLGSGTNTAAVSVGAGAGSCTGAQVGTTTVGCNPVAQPSGKQLTVSVSGQVTGDHTVSL